MAAPFLALLRGALRDRISLFYAVVIPDALLLILGTLFPSPSYRQQLIAGTVAISNFAQNEGQVSMLTNLVTMPMIFASEAFYRLDGAPAWVRLLDRALPFGHLIDGARAGLAGDAAGVLDPMLLLAIYTILTLAISVITFRWDPDAPPLRWSPHRRRPVAAGTPPGR